MGSKRASGHDRQTSHASYSRGMEEEEGEEKGEGTRAGLAPLTTGPGLPSNP